MSPADLVAWRLAHGLGPQALARALGVTYVTVYRWEHSLSPLPAYLNLALKGLEHQRKDRQP